jgi:hypothetical protein
MECVAMGVGVVPVYEPEVPPEAVYHGDGKGLAEEFETLNTLAAAAGLRSLRDFAEDEFAEFEKLADAAGSPELRYHPVGAGLATVDGLIREIRSNPEVASKLSNPDYTLEELEELARSLRAAEASGAQFCLFFA